MFSLRYRGDSQCFGKDSDEGMADSTSRQRPSTVRVTKIDFALCSQRVHVAI